MLKVTANPKVRLICCAIEEKYGRYKDLKVWQLGMELVFRIYAITARFPKEELFCLVSQMRRAAISIVSNIAEGKGRTGSRELAHFLSNSRGSLRELETQILIAAHQNYFSREIEKELLERIDEISRMIAGLMKYASGSDRSSDS